jgi:hypothetical protein
MVVIPPETPETEPVDEPTEATEGAALVQVPPETELTSRNELPTQTGVLPVIAAGTGFTVTIVV